MYADGTAYSVTAQRTQLNGCCYLDGSRCFPDLESHSFDAWRRLACVLSRVITGTASRVGQRWASWSSFGIQVFMDGVPRGPATRPAAEACQPCVPSFGTLDCAPGLQLQLWSELKGET